MSNLAGTFAREYGRLGLAALRQAAGSSGKFFAESDAVAWFRLAAHQLWEAACTSATTSA